MRNVINGNILVYLEVLNGDVKKAIGFISIIDAPLSFQGTLSEENRIYQVWDKRGTSQGISCLVTNQVKVTRERVRRVLDTFIPHHPAVLTREYALANRLIHFTDVSCLNIWSWKLIKYR